MSRGEAFASLFCPEGRAFVHNDCPWGRVFCSLQVVSWGGGEWFWMKLIPALASVHLTLKQLLDWKKLKRTQEAV